MTVSGLACCPGTTRRSVGAAQRGPPPGGTVGQNDNVPPNTTQVFQALYTDDKDICHVSGEDLKAGKKLSSEEKWEKDDVRRGVKKSAWSGKGTFKVKCGPIGINWVSFMSGGGELQVQGWKLKSWLKALTEILVIVWMVCLVTVKWEVEREKERTLKGRNRTKEGRNKLMEDRKTENDRKSNNTTNLWI